MATILIRADASVSMGTGHVMRCLAIAQHWRDAGGDAAFVMAENTNALSARLEAESFRVIQLDVVPGSMDDVSQLVEFAKKHRAAWVVVDGYQFKPEYQRRVKDAQLRLLWMDDNGGGAFYLADLVVNQNLHANADTYRQREPYTRLLLGTRYALLRREFIMWKARTREFPALGRKLLVTLGGSDPQNLTGRVLEALGSFGDAAEAVVIVGGSNPHLAAIERAASSFEGSVRLERDVYSIAEWMAWADVAVSAAGSTCWEMCFFGLPAIVIDVAPNQSRLARELHRVGAVVHIDHGENNFVGRLAQELHSLLGSAERRRLLSVRARKLVDGRGAARVATVMHSELIEMRRATPEDCRMVWQWANDPKVREASFQSASIPWKQHELWFENKLHDPTCFLFIGMDQNGEPLGQVRFDSRRENDLEISISLAPERRGLGLGLGLMRKAMRAVLRERSLVKLHALIKPGNGKSIRLFQQAGFREVEAGTTEKHGALHFVFDPAANAETILI